MKHLRTVQIARSVGVHPNTVRLYEAWGFLSPVARSQSGYRLYTEAHLDQAHVVWLALRFTWLGGEVRRTALGLIEAARDNRLDEALQGAHRILEMIQAEQQRAEDAVHVVEQWASAPPAPSRQDHPAYGPYRQTGLPVRQVAAQLDVTADMLRNWERNGLLIVPRDASNGYRVYGPAEIERLQVIRALSRAHYGTQAILRMMLRVDQGERVGLREALDTPEPDDECLSYATDRWLSTLAELERHGLSLVTRLGSMIQRRTEPSQTLQ